MNPESFAVDSRKPLNQSLLSMILSTSRIFASMNITPFPVLNKIHLCRFVAVIDALHRPNIGNPFPQKILAHRKARGLSSSPDSR